MKYITPEAQFAKKMANVDHNTSVVKENAQIGEQVNATIREKGYSNGEEKAILRKTLHMILVELNLTDDPRFAEFEEYNKFVEETKKEIKEHDSTTK